MKSLLAIIASLGVVSSALADDICADRPAKATGTCTVKSGHWQVSDQFLDGSFTHDGTTTDQFLILAPTLKYGVSHRLDVEAYFPVMEEVQTHSSGTESNVVGNGDLTLRAKYKIVYTGPVEFGIEPFIKVPIAHSDLGNRAWEGGALVPVGLRLTDKWMLGFDPEIDVLRDKGDGGRHLATQQVVSLSREINKFTLSGELWMEYNFDPTRGTFREYSADLVLAYVIAKHFEVDTGINFGLNRYTPQTQVYVGFAKRF